MPEDDIRRSDPLFEIRVPGSIANLGPGLDTLAVAINLYLDLRVFPQPEGGGLRFCFPDGAPDGENLVERAFRYMARLTGAETPSLRVEVRTEIPARAGLGSSAAATVAGLRLFAAAVAPVSPAAMLAAANALEGHPDNVAACLLGGLSISMETSQNGVAAASSPWPAAIGLLTLTPAFPLSTQEARRALPATVPLRDAVSNLQRVAFLVWALQSGRASSLQEALQEAFQDALHQPHRERLVPGLAELLKLRHPDLLGACLSGAGPSLVAFVAGRSREVEDLIAQSYRSTGIPFTLRWLKAHNPSEKAPEAPPGAAFSSL